MHPTPQPSLSDELQRPSTTSTDVISEDREQLKLLSIFHYVVGGFTMLFSLFPVIHLVVGIGIITGEVPIDASTTDGTKGPDEKFRALFGMVGWFFTIFAGGMVVTGISIGICTLVAAGRLKRRERWTFCAAIAGINCVIFPFGTVLGVFTLLVLMRPSVKAAFGYDPA